MDLHPIDPDCKVCKRLKYEHLEFPHVGVDFGDMLPEEHWTIPRVILVSIVGLLLTWWFAVLFLSAFSGSP